MIEAIAILAGAVIVGVVLLHRQLNAIHALVNANLTKAQTDLTLADARIRTLEDHIAHEPGAKTRK